MGLIRANVEELSAFATNCREQAGTVGGVGAPPQPGNSFQATSTAVATAHADVATTTTDLMARLQATAAEAGSAAAGFAMTEQDNAATVSAVHAAAV